MNITKKDHGAGSPEKSSFAIFPGRTTNDRKLYNL